MGIAKNIISSQGLKINFTMRYNAFTQLFVYQILVLEMGKAKKRILHKTNSNLYMTRESAVLEVSKIINRSIVKKQNSISGLITLFGLSAEELSEAGVPYENLVALSNLIE